MNVRIRHLACCRTGSMHINGRVDRLIFPWVDIEQSRCIITLHRVISAPMRLNANFRDHLFSWKIIEYLTRMKKKKKSEFFFFLLSRLLLNFETFVLSSGRKDRRAELGKIKRIDWWTYLVIIHTYAFDNFRSSLRVIQKYTYCWLGKLSFTDSISPDWRTPTHTGKGIHWNRLNVNIRASPC